MKRGDPPGSRPEPVIGILGVDPALDGMPTDLYSVGQRKRLTGRDAELFLDQIVPRDLLRHRVLYLDARIHLQEVEASIAIEQKLHGAGADVADRLHAPHRRRAHLSPQLRIEHRAG